MNALRPVLSWGIPLALAILVPGLAAADQQEMPAPPSVHPTPATSAAPGGGGPGDRHWPDFASMTKGAKEYDGLFKLYQKDEHLYAEVRPDQFDRPMICPIAIARGAAMGGYTLNFDEQWVLVLHRVSESKVHLLRRNVRFHARPGTPMEKAVETTYTDSVLLALHVQTVNPMRGTVVLDLSEIFLRDFAELPFGMFDRDRSTWGQIKAFPKNVEIEVQATYAGGGRMLGMLGDQTDDSVPDPRGRTLVIHYGLSLLPSDGYQPRLADDRVGHFLSVTKDFSTDNKDTTFVRYINRWRLEKVNPSAKRSPPKKKIVFWIEKSVPDEYRSYVRDGFLEWNKAFEKIGFRDVIEVRQQESEEFDPEDINYNTFRWITTSRGFAMGPSRANPLTGEILDADIIFDADMVRYWRQEYQLLAKDGGAGSALALNEANPLKGVAPARLFDPLAERAVREELPPEFAANLKLRARFLASRAGLCQFDTAMKGELAMAELALTGRGLVPPGERVPDEFLGQAIKDVVMHEVGHTLGLRHNFKASTMLDLKDLQDTEKTHKMGLVGSVMDYTPVNLAPKGTKQGDYFPTTLGPYDYWAIEYAYKPLSGGTEGEVKALEKIAARCAEPGLDYGTDEDAMFTPDPYTNRFDLSSDPAQFGQQRMLLAEELMKNLVAHVIDKGEGFQRTRTAFNALLRQYVLAAELTVKLVGGESVHRDHRGDPKARDPFVPVPAAKQRQAVKWLQDHILTDAAFQFPPSLLRRLAPDRWSHWGNEAAVRGDVEYPINARVLDIQQIVLDHMLSPKTLQRLQTIERHVNPGEPAYTIADVFHDLTEAIWPELQPAKPDAKSPAKLASSVIRRNLQRDYVRRLSEMVLGPKAPRGGGFMMFILMGGDSAGGVVPADARSLARMHLKQIMTRIEGLLKAADAKQLTLDATTRAHLEETRETISRVLGASLQIREP